MAVADFIIIGILAVIIFFAVRSLTGKKSGGQCTGGCSGCSGCSGCAAGCGAKLPKEKAE